MFSINALPLPSPSSKSPSWSPESEHAICGLIRVFTIMACPIIIFYYILFVFIETQFLSGETYVWQNCKGWNSGNRFVKG